MHTVPTFTATIHCGLREGYAGRVHDVAEVNLFCLGHCAEIGLGVSLTETRFIYKDGSEPGVAVGLINHPRFPSTETQIKREAIDLATGLKKLLGQRRVTVVFPDETVMIGGTD